MSLLKSTYAEDFQPQGRPLPNGIYLVNVEEAGPESVDNGSQLARRYGNIRTREGATEFTLPDGSSYRIGGRKLFKRSWIDHKNPKAAEIGQREIKHEAAAAGLMEKPVKGGAAVELEFGSWGEYAAALVGKELLVRAQQKAKLTYANNPTTGARELVPVLDDDNNPVFEAEVVDWLAV